MRWPRKPKRDPQWKSWFAIFPVRMDDDGTLVWLEWVERKVGAYGREWFRLPSDYTGEISKGDAGP